MFNNKNKWFCTRLILTSISCQSPFDITHHSKMGIVFMSFWSVYKKKLIQLKLKTETILNLSTIYPSFRWYERELAEFSTISIKGLPDSRNLLLPYKRTFHLIKKKQYLKTSLYYKIIIQSDRNCINL